MRIEQPFHHGELAVQERLGESVEGQRNGRAIADSIMPGAFKFIEQQPFLIAGSTDAGGATWASFVVGEPGFAKVVDERTLDLDLQRSALHVNDPLESNLEGDPRLGVLLIEPGSRRRLRVNGHVERRADRSLRLHVDEAFPNCPKYIQRRHLRSTVDLDQRNDSTLEEGTELGEDQRALIRAADTLFVASANPKGHVDASHRGGPPGFIQLRGNTLWIPDYPGNHMYNTLGNVVVNPRAGLVAVDFESGRTLQLTGRAVIVWDTPGHEAETGGTNRFWTFTVDRWQSFPLPVRLEWEYLDASPHNPPPADFDG